VKLFVSYRRTDSPFVAGRLKDRMVDAFGEDNVFYDVESIGPGDNFPEEIGKRVNESDAMLAVIGPNWDPSRLQSEDDWVRIELEQALRSGTRLVPILIDPARMPTREQLPASLDRLPSLNARPLRPDPDFNTDVERLLDGLKKPGRTRRRDGGHRQWTERTRRRVLVGGFLAVVGVLLVIAVVNSGGGEETTEATTIPPATEWAGDPLRSELDTQRWTVATGSGVSVASTSNGVAIALGASAAAGAQGWIQTTCRFSADFVVSVAYDRVSWDPSARPRLGLLAMVDDKEMLALERFSDGNPDVYSIDFGQGKFTPAKDRPPAFETGGELRLQRQSGVYTAQFRENGDVDWHDIGKGGASFTEPVAIGISVWSARTGSDRAARFHDFVVESGTCVP
jgi:hypothetical protein